ncbi:exported hypothetical protein [Verrucomicrobia bacterium]|nr:exported hypothetical protein [Verrucomicrobiota bacterium]
MRFPKRHNLFSFLVYLFRLSSVEAQSPVFSVFNGRTHLPTQRQSGISERKAQIILKYLRGGFSDPS